RETPAEKSQSDTGECAPCKAHIRPIAFKSHGCRMKKHEHNRFRHEPKAQPAPKEVLISTRTGGAWPRRICWLAGVALVLLLGFFAFHKHHHPIAPVAV